MSGSTIIDIDTKPTLHIKKEPFIPLDKFTPDPKKHLYVSLTKSAIRIGGYLLILGIDHGMWGIFTSGILVLSEVIGILEELV